MTITPALTVADDPLERVTAKLQQLAALRPALLRLLEWQIDQELERSGAKSK